MPVPVSRRSLIRRLVPALPVPAPMAAEPAIVYAARATFGADPATIAELRTLGYKAWLTRQLDPDAIYDGDTEAIVEVVAEPYTASAADLRLLVRALHSTRQLQWRMVHFLNNHFATYRGSTTGISETDEDDAFRAVCFRDFATVLRTSATSPAMIDFLDSQTNVAGNPNENYARELLELHTLGVNGGYTEADVAEVARVFTGWSRVNVRDTVGGPVVGSSFRFRASRHDNGPKTTSFGWSTPGIGGANGYQEGYALLDFLAAHPSTATRFTTKLCQYFVADQPPSALLSRVRQVFTRSNGDLRSMLLAIFLDPEFLPAAGVRDKVHDGFEFVVDKVRRLAIASPRYATLNARIGLLRGQPHQNPVPTGYPEVGPPWQGAGNVLPRWDLGDDLAHNRVSQTPIDWQALYPTWPQDGAGWVGPLIERLLDGQVPATTTLALTVFMDARLATLPSNPTWAQLRPHARALLSLVLRLPESQLH